jgi:hypothetical protein
MSASRIVRIFDHHGHGRDQGIKRLGRKAAKLPKDRLT